MAKEKQKKNEENKYTIMHPLYLFLPLFSSFLDSPTPDILMYFFLIVFPSSFFFLLQIQCNVNTKRNRFLLYFLFEDGTFYYRIKNELLLFISKRNFSLIFYFYLIYYVHRNLCKINWGIPLLYINLCKLNLDPI